MFVERRQVEISDSRIFVDIKILALVKSRANGGVVHKSVEYVSLFSSQASANHYHHKGVRFTGAPEDSGPLYRKLATTSLC